MAFHHRRTPIGNVTLTAEGLIRHHKLPNGVECPVALKAQVKINDANLEMIKSGKKQKRHWDKKHIGGNKLVMRNDLPVPVTDEKSGKYVFVLPGGMRFAA